MKFNYISKLNKLNGWQRLWLFISIFYVLIILLYSLVMLPSKATIKYDDVQGNFGWYLSSTVLENKDTGIMRNTKYGQKIYIINDQRIDISRVISEYEKTTDKVYSKILFYYIVQMVGLCMLPVIFMYLIGTGISWVMKGFGQRT